jgi:hypothetical protein
VLLASTRGSAATGQRSAERARSVNYSFETGDGGDNCPTIGFSIHSTCTASIMRYFSDYETCPYEKGKLQR